MYLVFGTEFILTLAIMLVVANLIGEIFPSFVFFVLLITGLYFLNNNFDVVGFMTNKVDWLVYNWHLVIMGVAIYVAIGILWSAYKWYTYVRSYIPEINGLRVIYDSITLDEKKKYDSFADFISKYSSINRYMSVGYNKAKIIKWIVFWWASLIATFFGDWLYNFFNHIYEMCTGLYKYIVKLALSDVDMS